MENSSSYNDILEQSLKENNSGNITVGGIEFESEDERRRYLLNLFPMLVKEDKFVQAMELVHGNGSFNWFYRLVDKFSKWLVKKTEHSAAEKEKTAQEDLMDQAA